MIKEILLVYPPFCTPVIPPHSIANIYTFLKNNLNKEDYNIDVLDLNVLFHKLKFEKHQEFFKNIRLEEYEERSKEFLKESQNVYSINNKLVVEGNNPEHFDMLLKKIMDHNPSTVALSIVYSSQAFYASRLIDELKKQNIEIIIGGPAVNDKLREKALALNNELELLDHINGAESDHNELNYNEYIDFSGFELNDYFVKEPVIPLRTSTSCYYKQCAFCTHHQNTHYYEFPVEYIKKTIEKSGAKHFFIIDDMIHKKRLLEIAEEIKFLNVIWTCQLKPTKELDFETFQILYNAGLRFVIWGVESGNDRVLKLMKKATNKKDIKQVLHDSHDAGIKNGVYIMFGFPTETKEELLETIDFVKENGETIDLISTSIFGLQKGSPVYRNPEDFSITRITETKRTILEPKISYEISQGLTNEEAAKLRKKYKKTIENINKYPKTMNFFREHLLSLL